MKMFCTISDSSSPATYICIHTSTHPHIHESVSQHFTNKPINHPKPESFTNEPSNWPMGRRANDRQPFKSSQQDKHDCTAFGTIALLLARLHCFAPRGSGVWAISSKHLAGPSSSREPRAAAAYQSPPWPPPSSGSPRNSARGFRVQGSGMLLNSQLCAGCRAPKL